MGRVVAVGAERVEAREEVAEEAMEAREDMLLAMLERRSGMSMRMGVGLGGAGLAVVENVARLTVKSSFPALEGANAAGWVEAEYLLFRLCGLPRHAYFRRFYGGAVGRSPSCCLCRLCCLYCLHIGRRSFPKQLTILSLTI